MTRKLLIISPHFPPVNAVDHQRVRMATPYLLEFGWQATILAVSTEQVQMVHDPLLVETIPKTIRLLKTKALDTRLLSWIGLNSLAYRAQWHLRRVGDELLRKEKFDLVFFSTTLFPLMVLGYRWWHKARVPYVLDFQDPWVSDYYDLHPEKQPPGGKLKYGFSQWVARRLEPAAVRAAAQIICVSPSYPPMFLRRYPDLTEDRFTTIPFGGAESDFAVLPKLNIRQSLFQTGDGRIHWVYIGAAVEGMSIAIRAFCQALGRFLEKYPELRVKLRVHFAGTDYAPQERARKTIEPIAREYGLEDVITERTDRLPYFEVLQCLSEADALFIPGSDDPGYTASKLFPYILARKPMLAVFHQNSSVSEILRKTKAGTVVTFDHQKNLQQVTDEIYEKWFANWPPPVPATNWEAFEPYTARAMTQQLCKVFERAAVENQRN